MKKLLCIFLLSFSTLLSAADNPLGTGDMLRITVYDNPDLTTETRVTSDNTITTHRHSRYRRSIGAGGGETDSQRA